MKKSKPRVATKRKTLARPRAGASKFAPGEYVRIVPLHYPKPSVSIDEMGRLRAEPPDTDLFDGQPHVAAATAHLTYNNGPLLTGVQVFSVTDSPPRQQLKPWIAAETLPNAPTNH